MSSTLSRESVIVLGGIVSSDPLCCADSWVDSPRSLACDPPGSVASWVDSLSRDLVCSKLAPADWLTSLFCDPAGCEPVSPEHPTAKIMANPISKAPASAMSHAWRTMAHPASLYMCPMILVIGSLPHYEAQRISGERGRLGL